jgi:AraC-like DNA-binding protein
MRRQFAATYGTTPRRYQVATRLTRAAELLRGTTLAVKEIAADVGFPTVHAFERAFKQAHGVTPTVFRIKSLFPSPRT